MKILVDTNVFIAAEDISRESVHVNAEFATEFVSLCRRVGVELFVHPATRDDIRRTVDQDLRRASEMKLRQWGMLRESPTPLDLAARAGYAQPLSENDQSDLQLLTALESRSVDLLVTEDRGLLRRAARAGLEMRAIRLLGSIDYLKQLFGELVTPPAVESVLAYEISPDEEILSSVRDEYTTAGDSFDAWFDKVRGEHRECRVIRTPSGPIQGLAIYKTEVDHPFGIQGKTLKICTFKIAPDAVGAKRGELLLKATLQYANATGMDAIYVTLFEHHTGLSNLLERFGFAQLEERSSRGEIVYVKSMRPDEFGEELSPLDFHIKFGPPALKVRRAFVVPIKPVYHDTLFPEAAIRPTMFGPEPSGNAILKAYLCRSPTTLLRAGDTLLFYRSQDLKAVTAVGVVESAERIYDPTAVRERVGFRTVYPDSEIRAMFARGPYVLTILFRQDRLVNPVWGINVLRHRGVVQSAPQSIVQVTNNGAMQWIRDQLEGLP